MLFARNAAVFFAIVALVAGADPKDDAAVAAKGAKNAGVVKAIQLLSELQKKVMEEGEQEAKTYNKFACFCKDTTTEKLESIQKGTDEKDTLTADIQALDSKRTELDGQIKDAVDAIKKYEDEMKESADQRAKELKLYEENSADLKAALKALDGAIKSLKASKPASLVQLKSMSEGVRSAVALADALGLGGSSASNLASFLQADDVPMEDYKFKSDSVIETLEGLEKDFRAERTKVDEAEVEAVSLHDKFMQEKTDLIKEETTKLEKAKKDKEKAIADIAGASQRLSTVAANLIDDKEYATELSKMCADKAKTWDQRSQMRADEIQVLTQAINIVQTTVSEKTSANTIRFAQQGVSLRRAKAMANNADAMEAIEAEAEENEAPRVALLALARRHRTIEDNPDAGRKAIQALLRTRGMELKSTLLTALASQIGEDHFAKIKTLIQELIERLQQESTNEANQKGWCDKAMAEATQKREYAAEEVTSLNSELASLEALRKRLTLELDDLAKAIKEIQDAQAEAIKLRGEEKTEHEAIVKEAQEGLDALNMVIDILDKFYKTAAKTEVALVQNHPEDDMPDAGFDNSEAYTGAQGDAGGVMGMLEVMKSDFIRTVTETEAAEKQAEQDHLEFMTQSGMSLAEKEAAQKEKTRQLTDANSKFDEGKENLDAEMKKMKTAISELMELRPTCIDTGMSYEDRVARREEELAALQKALCILGAYQTYGPDGLAGQCDNA